MCGIPSCASSHAVSPAPWFRGRVSDPHVKGQTGTVSPIHRGQGGAPVDRRQPTGVAVRQDLQPPGWSSRSRVPFQDFAAMQPDRAACGDVGVSQISCVFERCGFPVGGRQGAQLLDHLAQGPFQVHGCRTSVRQSACRRFEPTVRRGRPGAQGQPVRGGNADQRRPAHPHFPNGFFGVLERLEAYEAEFMGEPRLVDDLGYRHCAGWLYEADRPYVPSVYEHANTPVRDRGRTTRQPRRAASPGACGDPAHPARAGGHLRWSLPRSRPGP